MNQVDHGEASRLHKLWDEIFWGRHPIPRNQINRWLGRFPPAIVEAGINDAALQRVLEGRLETAALEAIAYKKMLALSAEEVAA